MRFRSRPGFSLVELLVAITILNVGLLALASTSASLVRRHDALRARAAAVRTAAIRLELLAASGCAAVSGSAAVPNGPAERWTIGASAAGARDIAEEVTYPVARGTATLTFRTRVAC